MIARPTGLLGHEMTRIPSPLQERIALEGRRLAIRVTRHPYGPPACLGNPSCGLFIHAPHPTGCVAYMLASFSGGVKTRWTGVGNHLFAGHRGGTIAQDQGGYCVSTTARENRCFVEPPRWAADEAGHPGERSVRLCDYTRATGTIPTRRGAGHTTVARPPRHREGRSWRETADRLHVACAHIVVPLLDREIHQRSTLASGGLACGGRPTTMGAVHRRLLYRPVLIKSAQHLLIGPLNIAPGCPRLKILRRPPRMNVWPLITLVPPVPFPRGMGMGRGWWAFAVPTRDQL